jgi:protein gp37
MSTSIQWTDETWNPVVGCARVSPGCENCYAERVAHRGLTERHRGLTVVGKHGPRWIGEARFVPEALGKPLHWRKPRRVFVNSMSDLFHDDITFEQIAAVFGVMAATPHLTYQVLTKRPARMVEFFRWMVRPPLPNVWLGVSVEDQRRADERIPLLLECPAAVRFLSVEPLLGPVYLDYAAFNGCDSFGSMPWIGWVIVGGESGPGARVCDLDWIREVVKQCRVAGVPCFVKQLGSAASDPKNGIAGAALKVPADFLDRVSKRLRDRKGGDMDEWPENLRVQEFPVVRGLAAVRGEEVADG